MTSHLPRMTRPCSCQQEQRRDYIRKLHKVVDEANVILLVLNTAGCQSQPAEKGYACTKWRSSIVFCAQQNQCARKPILSPLRQENIDIQCNVDLVPMRE